jgi:parallel beta-helix repeat protein
VVKVSLQKPFSFVSTSVSSVALVRDRRATLFLPPILCLLLVCFPVCHIVEANPFTNIPLPEPAFVIRSDGSIDPSSAPIHRDGDIYTFTDNIVGYTIIVEKDDIILDGGGYTLKGYGSEGNFSLKGYADPTGILIMQQNGVTIRNMKISGFSYGIKITNLFSIACTNNILENNSVTDNYYGVRISGSWYTVLRNNILNNNVLNFYVYDFVSILPPASDIYINDIDSSNTVDGKPIIYWVNEQDKTVPSDAGYVALVNCTNMTVQNLDLAHNGQGIVLVSTIDSLITKNHVTNTEWGIFVHNSSNLVITENNLESNDIGIETRRSSNVRIVGNIIKNNHFGMGIYDEHPNHIIHHNDFVENVKNLFIAGENTSFSARWDDGKEGNYWSNYNGTDNDGDGIGDSPYVIDENNQDNYPLMEPTVIPEFPSWTVLPLFLTVTMVVAIYKKRLPKTSNN